MNSEIEPETEETGYDWSALRSGPKAVLSVAALVMSASFIGFGALVRAQGFELEMGLATLPLIWALPGQVLYLNMLAEGAGLIAIFLAVSVAAVRLMPMVMLVLSEVDFPKAPKVPQYFLAHFIAMTTWVLAQERIAKIPRRQRLPWLFGLVFALFFGMMLMTTLGYVLAGLLPPILAATLAFLTPIFFYMSLFANARFMFDFIAIAMGTLLIVPLMHFLPEYDLLIAGIAGGTAAWIFAPRKRRS
ncbi:MAG: AzlC family ABC transporter permease [Hyphomicrobiales bacterium]